MDKPVCSIEVHEHLKQNIFCLKLENFKANKVNLSKMLQLESCHRADCFLTRLCTINSKR